MKDILINLLIIVVILLSTQLIWQWHKMQLNQRPTKVLIFIASFVLILFCMTFSIKINHQFMYDLRVVPLMIGSLYGGPIVSLALYVTIVLYRLILGIDLGLFGAMINYGLLTILLSMLSRRFIKSTLKMRLMIACIAIGFHLLLGYIIYTHMLFSGMPSNLYWQSSLIKTGTIIIFITIGYAIDRYYKLRLQLDSLEKMELVYHLSASISHEVRNGLTSARGFMQLLNESENEPQKRNYIRIALAELDRTENIVRDFLTFAKPNLKQIKEIQLENLINNTLILLEPLSNMYSIVVRKKMIPSIIKGDESMIQQALINILKNAIEAMPDGGVLEVDLSVQKNELIISITDTGIGMNADQIERLGTPYFSTKGQKGTGLGMMVAFRVFKELHGTITIKSQVGKGTIFTICLPRLQSEP